jgi:DNA-directed RNA polymerase specialized sigma subunit
MDLWNKGKRIEGTDQEIADRLSVPLQEWLEARSAVKLQIVELIPEHDCLSSVEAIDDGAIEHLEMSRAKLRRKLSELSASDRFLIEEIFYKRKNRKDLLIELGIQPTVLKSQIRRALSALAEN